MLQKLLKNQLLWLCLVFLSTTSQSDPLWTQKGSDLVSGAAYNAQSYSGMTSNPAVPYESYGTADNEESVIHTGVFNNTTAYEVADVANIREKVNDLLTRFGNNNLTSNNIEELKTEAETVFQETESKGQLIAISTSSNNLIPSLRLSLPKLKSTLSFDYKSNYTSAPFSFGVTLESAPISIEPASCLAYVKGDNTKFEDCHDELEAKGELDRLCADPTNITTCKGDNTSKLFKLVSDTQVNLLGVSSYKHFSLGYSSRLYRDAKAEKSLFFGLRANYIAITTFAYQVTLTDAPNKKVKDLAEDIQKTQTTSDSGAYFDLGLTWTTPQYLLGATLTRLFAKNIHYKNETNKQVLQAPIASMQGSYYLNDSKSLSLNGHIDLNSYNDLTGQPFQWAVTSLSYSSKGRWLPGAGIGLRKNLAGRQLSYATLGFRGLGLLQGNIAYSIEQVGNLPQSVIFNLGIEWTI